MELFKKRSDRVIAAKFGISAISEFTQSDSVYNDNQSDPRAGAFALKSGLVSKKPMPKLFEKTRIEYDVDFGSLEWSKDITDRKHYLIQGCNMEDIIAQLNILMIDILRGYRKFYPYEIINPLYTLTDDACSTDKMRLLTIDISCNNDPLEKKILQAISACIASYIDQFVVKVSYSITPTAYHASILCTDSAGQRIYDEVMGYSEVINFSVKKPRKIVGKLMDKLNK